MGIHVIDDPSSTPFVLCAPRIGRTKKFVCAMAYGPTIISTSFLDECLTGKAGPPEPTDCLLVDAPGEVKLGCTLAEATARAKANGRKLFKGWQIFATEKVQGGIETYRAIVETNGGACLAFQESCTRMKVSRYVLGADGSEAASTSPRSSNSSGGRSDDLDRLFLVSGTSKQERELWGAFREMAARADMVPMIVSTDWLLGVAMAQKVLWRDEWRLDGS
jgi:hypothetical protein